MTDAPRLPFRDLLEDATRRSREDGGAAIIGAATSDCGLVLVSLEPGAFTPKRVDRYFNIAIGPVKDDNGETLDAIASLPELPDFLDQQPISKIYLVASRATPGPKELDLIEGLHGAFPGLVVEIRYRPVSLWVAATKPSIKPLRIPRQGRWCTGLITRAVHTALYAETKPPSFRRTIADKNQLLPAPCRGMGEPQETVTAAAYSRPHLYVVTANRREDGFMDLDDERCASFIYDDRGTESVRSLREKLSAFLAQSGIPQIAFRCGANSGKYLALPQTYKLETILQLIDTVEVVLVTNEAITKWGARFEPDLPPPQMLGFDHHWRAGQSRAIEAAGYALSTEFRPMNGGEA